MKHKDHQGSLWPAPNSFLQADLTYALPPTPRYSAHLLLLFLMLTMISLSVHLRSTLPHVIQMPTPLHSP